MWGLSVLSLSLVSLLGTTYFLVCPDSSVSRSYRTVVPGCMTMVM